MVAVAPQSFPTHRDRRTTRTQRLLSSGQPGTQHRQAAGLGEPLGRAAITTTTARSTKGFTLDRHELAGSQCTPLFEHLDRSAQIRYLGGQATHRQLVLILRGTRDRPRPPRRRHRRDGPLTLRTPQPMSPAIQPTQPNPLSQLTAIHRTQQLAHRPQRLGLLGCWTYPGPNPRPRRRGRQHRTTNPT